MPETNVALTASGRDSVPETNVIICFVNLVLMMLFYFQLNKSSGFKTINYCRAREPNGKGIGRFISKTATELKQFI